MNYTKKLSKAKNKLFKLDSLYKIRELYFVNKFLSRIGIKYKIYSTIFSQTFSLIRKIITNRATIIIVAIFYKNVIVIKKEN